MEAFKRYRHMLRLRVANLATTDTFFTPEAAGSTADLLRKLRTELEDNYDDLGKTCADDELEGITAEFTQDLATVGGLLIRAAAHIHGPPDPPLSSSAAVDYRLQTIQLPTFHGKAEEWPTFSTLFLDAVRNQNVTGAQKLHLLLNNVKGAAQDTIAGIPPSETGFAEAWELLRKKYDNKRDVTYKIVTELVNQPIATTAAQIDALVDSTRKSIRSLKLLGCETTHESDTWLIPILLQKMDSNAVFQWDQSRECPADEIPHLETLLNFLQSYARKLKTQLPQPPLQSAGSQSKPAQNRPQFQKNSQPKQDKCPECSLPHYFAACPIYKKANHEDKWALIKKLHLCGNCLRPGHRVSDCHGGTCRQCQKKHHTSLHKETEKHATNASIATPVMLLPTAQVNMISASGKNVLARFLMDSGSTTNYMSTQLMSKLQLPSKSTEFTCATLTGTSTTQQRATEAVLRSRKSPFSHRTTFMELKQPQRLPVSPVNVTLPPVIAKKDMADQYFQNPTDIDGILGTEIIALVLQPKTLKHQGLLFQETDLGWIMMGPANSQTPNAFTGMSMNQDLTRFWELEEVPSEAILTPEQQASEQCFKTTTTILPDGRFQVKIPLRRDPPHLADTRPVAIARLKSLEKRMAKDSAFANLYKNTMQDYLDSGHMVKVPLAQLHIGPMAYLPHHGVISTNRTTKLRIVFDASAEASDGNSLNAETLNAPKTQDDLFHILLRFRTHAVAITGDIKKMYRQIWLDPCQLDLQRIVWRWSQDEPIVDYRLTTVTWGTKAAPYLATRVLNQIAENCKLSDPLVSNKIAHDFYVDDLLSGAESPAQAIQIYHDITNILMTHGFLMHKWASNCKEVMASIPAEDHQDSNSCEFVEPGDPQSKALGISWNRTSDTFQFCTKIPQVKRLTKRTILQQTNSIFDPVGWACPTTIRAKIFLQQLWKQPKLNWDTEITGHLASQWHTLVQDLQDITNISLERRISPDNGSESVLCAFCDASELAYAAVVYLRTTTPSGPVIRILAAKTKVAPLHSTSLPRLELCGAVLLAKLVNAVQLALSRDYPVYAWTDSTVALAWLTSHPSRWKTFVANRVSQIQSVIRPSCWRHVPGTTNPADCASRGQAVADLRNNELWWRGPPFLYEHGYADVQSPPQPPQDAPLEKKNHAITMTAAETIPLLRRYSSTTKLIRVHAYVLRFIAACRKLQTRGPLTGQEVTNATNDIWRRIQQEGFPAEHHKLSTQQKVSTSSPIASLSPFLDKDGIIRVGGRLRNAPLPVDVKHPVLLPPKHHVTRILLRELHVKHLHAGPQLLQTIVAQSFWIPRSKNLIKKTVHDCTRCTRLRAATAKQMMADLPSHRVTQSRPFTHVGVDFAGPVQLKTHHLRGNRQYKAWVAVFVCMATRAIHLEAVTSLSAEAFMATLHRFTARRGLPHTIYSDCGTNFSATAKALKSIQDDSEVKAELSKEKIRWQFNPPNAPHFGGLWEAGVASMKYHLHRVVGTTPLTYEEMSTVLTRIEAVLNSRPLTELSDDPNDFSALTPAHFLIGGPLLALPEKEVTSNVLPLKRWQLTQRLAQHFWRRWSSEYLTRLQQRPKWVQPAPNLVPGMLVLVKDENAHPLEWNLARIADVHPGNDGLVRAVTVRTAFRTFKRPVVKICPLPLQDPDQKKTVSELCFQCKV